MALTFMERHELAKELSQSTQWTYDVCNQCLQMGFKVATVRVALHIANRYKYTNPVEILRTLRDDSRFSTIDVGAASSSLQDVMDKLAANLRGSVKQWQNENT